MTIFEHGDVKRRISTTLSRFGQIGGKITAFFFIRLMERLAGKCRDGYRFFILCREIEVPSRLSLLVNLTRSGSSNLVSVRLN